MIYSLEINANLFIEPTDSVKTFSSLAAGQKVPVYFYIDYSNVCGNGTPFDGKTANYSLSVCSAENGTITRNASVTTNTLLSANAAGQALSSTISASSIYVGQTFTQNVIYEFGKEYDIAGTYLVRLVAVAANGCRETAYQQVQVKPSSNARFYAGTEWTMTARIQNLSRGSISHIWNFGEESSLVVDNSFNLSYTYSTAGWKIITLIAVAANGCSDTAIGPVFPFTGPKPTANFKYDTLSCGNAIKFTSTSWAGTEFIWDFGDVGSLTNTSNSVQTAHSYNTNGTYFVRLIVKSSNGCADTIIREISVNGIINPVRASFNFNYVTCDCPNSNKVDFDNTSPGSGLNFLWLFVDGNTST